MKDNVQDLYLVTTWTLLLSVDERRGGLEQMSTRQEENKEWVLYGISRLAYHALDNCKWALGRLVNTMERI